MNPIAATPDPPYFAVIFTSRRSAQDNGYQAMADRMVELAAAAPGFLGFESARGELGISVSYWADLESIRRVQRLVFVSPARRVELQLVHPALRSADGFDALPDVVLLPDQAVDQRRHELPRGHGLRGELLDGPPHRRSRLPTGRRSGRR